VHKWSGSYDLFYLVRGHVETAISTLEPVSVVDVRLIMPDGRGVKRYTINRVQAVMIKLSNGGVISVTVETSYRTKTVMHLAGHERAEERDTLASAERWSVYVVRCNDDSLYCGISKNVENRVKEHNGNCRGAKYTRSRRPVSLAREWEVGSRADALKAERRFKKLKKKRKEELCARGEVTASTAV
jgi:putative endonuclease